MDNSTTIGLDPGITITTSTLVPDNTFYIYGSSGSVGQPGYIGPAGVTGIAGTSTTIPYVTWSGLYSIFPPVEIKFGFIIKFKRSAAKLDKSWTDDLQPKEESKLKRIL